MQLHLGWVASALKHDAPEEFGGVQGKKQV